MKKWIMLGIVAAVFIWFFWCCFVMASNEDDRLEGLMKNEEIKKCSEVTDEHERK